MRNEEPNDSPNIITEESSSTRFSLSDLTTVKEEDGGGKVINPDQTQSHSDPTTPTHRPLRRSILLPAFEDRPHRELKRNVSFPEDISGGIVTRYIDAPNPWFSVQGKNGIIKE